MSEFAKTFDVTDVTEDQARKLFGKKMTNFMRDVAKASKKHKIEAYALWMYHNGIIRQCSMGTDDKARVVAYNIALMMAEQSKALLEDAARKAAGVKDQ